MSWRKRLLINVFLNQSGARRQPLLLQPRQAPVGHLTPSAVDDERVAAVFELEQLRGRSRVAVLLQRAAAASNCGRNGADGAGPTVLPSLEGVDMELGLASQVVIVTGASRGIGLAITRGFVDAGAQVVAGARTISAELKELAAAGSLTPVEVDLAQPDGPSALVAAAGERIDVVVNNVGSASPRLDGFLAITDEMWQQTLNLDLLSAVRTMRAAIPVMLRGDGGVIVNIGSVNARLPDPAVLDYSAAKAAIVSVSKSLSKEFGPRGIRVNTVAPGPVATDLWLGAGGVAARIGQKSGQKPEDVAAAAASSMVTGRFTRPDEVADLVLFLAGARAENITGADFLIDGGLVTTT